ncbi:MAG: TonB family protein [Melioribacteraceae bacterium]
MMKKLLLLIAFLISTNVFFAQNGIRKIYYAKGKLESAVSFSDEVLDGNSKWYYFNGNLKSEKNYSDGTLNGWISEFYENGLLKEKHFVREGVLAGISKKNFDNGALQFVRVFEKGKLKNSKIFEYDSLFVATMDLFVGRSEKNISKSESEFLCNIDLCPEPIDGIEAIEKNIIYPIMEKKNNVEGFVLVTVLIDKRGNTKKVQVIKSLGSSFDEATKNVIKKTKFFPGKDKGIVVETEVTFRVNIKIKN